MIQFLFISSEEKALPFRQLIQELEPSATIQVCSSLNEAVWTCAGRTFQAIFLLLEHNGEQVLKAARQILLQEPRLNLIFLASSSKWAMQAWELHASDYLLLPCTKKRLKGALESLRYPELTDKEVYAQTFSNFELFYKGQPVPFETRKAKEVMAYLIDRRGTMTSNGEIAAVLWEDNDNILSVQTQMRKAKSALVHSLEAAGIEKILLRGRSEMGLDTNLMDSDYWQLLRGERRGIQSFMGEYQSSYSWGEATLSALTSKYPVGLDYEEDE